MNWIADGMLLVAALTAAFYCRVLAIRLRRLGQTDQGLGGAISHLNHEVEEMKKTLQSVAIETRKQTKELGQKTTKAEAAARRLELLLASLHHAEDVTEHPKPVLKLSPDEQLFSRVRSVKPPSRSKPEFVK